MMLRTLRQYQDRVEALANEAERRLRTEGRTGLAQAARLRFEQGPAIAAYQLFVHRELFEPLMKTGTPAQIEAAKRLKIECVNFCSTFCRYTQHWSKRDLSANWNEYRPAALAMIAAIRAHIARVRNELGPVLVGWDDEISDARPEPRHNAVTAHRQTGPRNASGALS